jgi:hypothetical protein
MSPYSGEAGACEGFLSGEGVALLWGWAGALGHDEEGVGAGAEVVGDRECPKGEGEEEVVAGSWC